MTKSKKNLLFDLCILVGLIVIVSLANTGSEGISVDLQDDVLTLEAADTYSISVELSSITSLDITQISDFGSAADSESASASDKCYYGIYSSEAWETYTLCALKDVSTCIVLETKEGVVVFNCESDEATEEFYRAFVEYLGLDETS